MIGNDTQKWIRASLAVPCLFAALCFTQVGCGGGDDAATGTTDTSTDAGSETDGTESTE